MLLPSKKVLSLLLITVSFVVFTILVFGKKNTAGKQIIASTLRGGADLALPTNSNWEQILNRDTETNQYPTSTENSTLTDQISISMISNYLSLKQSGSIDETDINNIVNTIKPYAEDVDLLQVKISDLNVVSNSNKESIAKYGEDLGNILKKHKPTQAKNEILILQESLSGQNPEKIKDLEEAAHIYGEIAIELKKMKVPQVFLKAHIDTVNGMNNLAAGLREIQGVFEDPILALKGLTIYQSGGDMFTQSVRASSEFIQKNNISYKQGTGGYYLLYGI